MSIKYLSNCNNQSKIFGNSSGTGTGTGSTPWVRNPGWLTLPSVEGEQKFVGLHRIDPECNFASLKFTCSGTGVTYTVDWGDGTVENIASGTQANHLYDYDTYDTSNTTLVTHNGVTYKQAIVTVTPTTTNLLYCQLEVRYPGLTTVPGAYETGWLDIAINGSFLSIISISGSGISTGVTLMTHSALEQVAIYDNVVTSFAYCFSKCYNLQSIPVLQTASPSNMQYMFENCYNLKTIPLLNTASVTYTQYMFKNCYSLVTIPLLNTASVTNMSYMFQNCYALKTIPLLNTASVTNMLQTFDGCYSLESVPLLNTANVTTMQMLFRNCYSLESVPLFNTVKVTDMSYMFDYCDNLITVPLFNTAAVTTMAYMLEGCYKLVSVPNFNMSNVLSTIAMFNKTYSLHTEMEINTPKATDMSSMFLNSGIKKITSISAPLVTTMSNMFNGCANLETVGNINVPLANNFTSMFQNCTNLKSITSITTNAASGTFSTMFQNCSSLSYIPALRLLPGTSFTNFVTGCTSLTKCDAYGAKYTISFTGIGKLGKNALENIMYNLQTSFNSSQVVTLTNNYGNDAIVSRTFETIVTSPVLNGTNTSGLAVGMWVVGSGTGLSNTIQVWCETTLPQYFRVANAAFSFNAGDRVSFTTIGTLTSGLSINTVYYVINPGVEGGYATFQLSSTPGGSAIPTIIGTSQTLTMKFQSKIISINPNVSVTLDKAASSSYGASALTFSYLNIGDALMKNWTVTR